MSLARKLAEPEDGLSHHEEEARQRSAISRAYYAVFCTARDIFDPEHKYRAPTEGSSHAKLWKQLKQDPEREEFRYIGERASRLGEYRRQADYDCHVTDLPYVVYEAIANAEDLKERLESLS